MEIQWWLNEGFAESGLSFGVLSRPVPGGVSAGKSRQEDITKFEHHSTKQADGGIEDRVFDFQPFLSR